MEDKILILGKGFIGTRIKQDLNCEISDCQINSLQDAEGLISKTNPTIIINCIGFTGKNNVDGCESEKDLTLIANTFVPIILAEAALRNNIRLIHISSGCIYNFDYAQDDPIDEERVPDYFELYYSRSKIYAEQVLKVLSRQYPVLILRIRIPLDNRPHPRNILDKLINYKKVIDIPNSVTYIPDFIEALKHLIAIKATGIYNVVNKGVLKFPELVLTYKKYCPDFEYQVVDYNTLGLERTNLIMSVEKLERSGFKMRNIKEVLDECVKDYLKY